MSGVNYFFSLTTTISPYQRQLLFDSRVARSAHRGRRAKPARRSPVFVFGIKRWRWESGNPVFGFPLFHPPRRRSCGNVGISPALGEISKGLWKQGEACFWLSTVSTGPSFPQLSVLPFFVFRAGRHLIRPRPGFRPVDSSWHAQPGSWVYSTR